MSSKTQRYVWLDVLKGLAILAVLADHFMLPLGRYSIYSVSTFFIILGFNAHGSMSRRHDSTLRGRLKACSSFIIFYCICTALYLLCFGTFSLANYYKNIVFFSADPPLYFCVVYIQLSLLSCFIYNTLLWFEKKEIFDSQIRKICSLLFLLVFTFFVSRSLETVVLFPELHGGGKFLFGSTYLFLLVAGMLIATHYERIEQWKTSVFLVSFATLCMSPLYINSIWKNPPIFMTCVYAFSIFFTVSFVPFSWNNLPSKILVVLGRYSIHIFMYHMLVARYTAWLNSKILSVVISLVVPILMGIMLDYVVLRKRPDFEGMFRNDNAKRLPYEHFH